MTQSPVTVTYSLEEVLKQIIQKLDTLQEDVNDIKVGQARLEERLTGEIKTLDGRLTGEIKTLDERLTGEIRTLDERLTGEIKTLNTKFDSLEKDVKEVKDVQGKQVWTLIGILIAAVGGFLVAVGRFVISGRP